VSLWSLICVYLCVICRVTADACVENRGGCWDIYDIPLVDTAGAKECQEICASESGCAFWFYNFYSAAKNPAFCGLCSKDEDWMISRGYSWCDVKSNCLWGPVDCDPDSQPEPTQSPTESPTETTSTTTDAPSLIECDVLQEVQIGRLYRFENAADRDVSFSTCFSPTDADFVPAALKLYGADFNEIQSQSINVCSGDECYGEDFADFIAEAFGEQCPFPASFTMAALESDQYHMELPRYDFDGVYPTDGNYELLVSCE